MGKCRACKNNECKRKYENRHMCENRENCTCTCQEEADVTEAKGFLNIFFGTAFFVGGTALTIATGGAGAIIVGALAAGAGSTAAITPLAKKINGERITAKEYCIDLALGTLTGLVTAGIGAGGAVLTTNLAKNVGTKCCTQGLVKLSARSVVGAASGVTSGLMQELVSQKSVTKNNIAMSALTGALTGGCGHLSGNVVKMAADTGVVKSATRVGMEVFSAVACDVSSQLIENKKVDLGRLAMNATTRAALSAVHESTKNAVYAANGGKEDIILKKQMKLAKVPEKTREEIKIAKEHIENVSAETLEAELSKTSKNSQFKKELGKLDKLKFAADKKIAELIGKKPDIMKETPTHARKDVATKLSGELRAQKAVRKEICAKIKSIKQSIVPKLIGEKENIHALKNRPGQIAVDLPDNINSSRGLRRAVFDHEQKDGKQTPVFVAYTDVHDYSKIPDKSQTRPVVEHSNKFDPHAMYKIKRDDDDDDGCSRMKKLRRH